jgi:serine/threonine protein kinase
VREHKKNLPEEAVSKIIKQVLNGLQYMQKDKNMIHRDIKPYNIMLAEKDNLDSVKIIDFGLAVLYAHNGVSDYSRCGTVLY